MCKLVLQNGQYGAELEPLCVCCMRKEKDCKREKLWEKSLNVYCDKCTNSV